MTGYISYTSLYIHFGNSTENLEYSHLYHLVSIAFGVYRGLMAVFRLFEGTSYFVEMLFQVFSDMKSFTIVFFGSIFWFSLVFFKLETIGEAQA